MTTMHRACLALAALILLGLGSVDFASAFPPPGGGFRPPPVRPPPPPPPVTGGRGGFTPGTAAGGRGGFTPGTAAGGRGGFTPGTFSGGMPHVRTPGEIASGMRKGASTNPTGTFRDLRGTEARILSEAARLDIAREATRALSERTRSSRDTVGSLREINAARREAASLPEGIRRPIERLHETTTRRLLGEALVELATLAEGKPAEVANRAETIRSTLREAGPPLSLKGEHAATEAACRTLAEVGGRDAALSRLEAALAGKGAPRDWANVDSTGLPEGLAKQADLLRGLAEVREAASEKGRTLGETQKLADTLRRLEMLAEPPLIKQVALDLAVKALLEGRPAEFERLMPTDPPPAEAARALRDLKALALGEGKVESWAGRQAVPDKPGEGPSGPRPPPGVDPLVPEGRREGWRPPVKEKPGEGLPALERATELGAKAAEAARERARAERGRVDTDAGKARSQVAEARSKLQAVERAEARRFATVEHRLDRRLTAEERMKAMDLLDAGKDAEAVLREIKAAQPDDDALYFAEVERLLGRRLTDTEKSQVRRLRREGRRPSEVAELLRS